MTITSVWALAATAFLSFSHAAQAADKCRLKKYVSIDLLRSRNGVPMAICQPARVVRLPLP
jgi:hypothetical protein